MMAGTGAAAGGSSTALKAVGDYYKNRDKISRQNKQIARAERKDIQGWLGQMQQYAAYNKAQLDQFEADIANLNQQYEFNGRARQEAIEAGLTQLADISDGFIERAFARNMKAAEASGRFLSTGQTGRTTKRMEGLSTKAVQGRGLALMLVVWNVLKVALCSVISKRSLHKLWLTRMHLIKSDHLS